MVDTLTPLADPPARNASSNTAFVADMDAWLVAQQTLVTEFNTSIEQYNSGASAAFTATSVSSVAVGTGTKNFTASTGCAFIPGQQIIAAYDASNFLRGSVTTYNSGTGAMVMEVTAATGSGTRASWTIGLVPDASTLADYLPKAGGTMTGAVTTATPASGQEAVIIPHGSAPSAPTNGSIWSTTTGLYGRFGGATLLLGSKAAVQHIPIPATAMTRRTTNGPAVGTSETATNKVMVETLDFDQSTAEYAQIRFFMPKRWDEGTVTVQFYWTATTTGNVVWAAQGVALSDDDVLDTAFGTAQTVTDGVTAANDLMISSATGAITIGGTPAAGDLVVFQFYRDASNGSDTLAADAKLLGVKIILTTDAGDDS